jgi:NAD+ kinase
MLHFPCIEKQAHRDMKITKIGILYHPMVEASRAKTEQIISLLTSLNIKVWSCSAWELEKAIESLDGTDLILTTGGDGTILRAAQVALQKQIPITGINMGNLGFLTEIKANEALERLPELLAGKGWIDERAMLEARLEPTEQGGKPELFKALNDIVLARGAIAKLIQVNTTIDGKLLTTHRADGVIMATATGSTGYSLAAGGPVIYPQSKDILLAPIVSHLSLGYSLVLPSSSIVKLELTSPGQATLSIDGHINIPVYGGAEVTVRQSTQKTRFLRLHEQNDFFGSLEEKLRGKK